MDYLEQLNWRYATKRMTGEKIPPEILDRIFESIRLTPSSFGLQPYDVLVIDDRNTKEKIYPEAYNQFQILESSHLLIFAAWKNITDTRVNEYIERISYTRNVSLDSLQAFQKNILKTMESNSAEQNFRWAANQCHIALGNALFAAALEGIDATPMGGFKPEGVDKVLDLASRNLGSVVLCALGYRDTKKDELAKSKKVRRSKESLFVPIKIDPA